MIDSGLETIHVPYSYGFSIIILTVFVKILTFPLSKQQVESSIAMQALQPQIKEIQANNKNNPQMAQQLTAQLYQSAGVNPLAGLPFRSLFRKTTFQDVYQRSRPFRSSSVCTERY